MSDPYATIRPRTLEPVHAEQREDADTRWTQRLVVFLRVMAVLSMPRACTTGRWCAGSVGAGWTASSTSRCPGRPRPCSLR